KHDRRRHHRALVHPQLSQTVSDRGDHVTVIASTDGTARHQSSHLVVRNEQRSERLAMPARSRADDHEVITLDSLDFQPERAALAGDVGGVTMLGHDPLQPTIQAGLVELDTLPFDMVRHEEVASRGDAALEPGPAPVQWLPKQ